MGGMLRRLCFIHRICLESFDPALLIKLLTAGTLLTFARLISEIEVIRGNGSMGFTNSRR